MRLPKAISVHPHRTGRNFLMLAMVLAFLLPACATQSLKIPAPPPLLNAGPPVVVPDVELLTVNAQMEKFLQRYVLEYDDPNIKRQLLSLAVSSKAMLGFHYNPERTLTAEEAFKTRSGNCLAFANLFIAMAREAGLKARYHEVQIPPEWDSQNDTFIVSRHINVVIEGPRGLWEVDISGQEIKVNAKRRIMQDSEATAMYFNNLAIEALFKDDLPTAHAYLSKAIEIGPGLADSWSNLGVVLLRNEQVRDAEMAYKTALMINPAELSAMGNLYDLYVNEENLTAANDLERRVERYRLENPYYLMLLSDEALEKREFDESIELLNRAIEKKEDEHRLHFALARTQYLSGHPDAAESSLNRARELAPEDIRSDYDRPLRELVQSESNRALN
jgi:tetratricopeptide (TPR) repeat protein